MINTIKNAVAKRRESAEGNDKGFTLIELLVVVLIIGILAAIAIPAFISQREGAWVSQVENDLKNAALSAEQFANDNGGSFASLTKEKLEDEAGFNPTDGVTIEVGTVSATRFELTGTNANLDNGDREFTYNNEDGKIVDESDTNTGTEED